MENGIARAYAEAAGIVREARQYVFAAVAVYLAGIAAGAAFSERLLFMLEPFRDIVQSIEGKGTAEVIARLFLQNSVSALLAVWLGMVFGVVPVVGALTNGIAVGLLLSMTDPAQLLVSLIPHGVFELPAIFIAWGLGMWRGAMVLRRDPERRAKGRNAYRVYFVIVVPLLIIAAVIEGAMITAAVR